MLPFNEYAPLYCIVGAMLIVEAEDYMSYLLIAGVEVYQFDVL